MQASRIPILLLAAMCGLAAHSAKADPPHPEPRVIVTVTSVQGPHERGDVERSARLAWGKIVRCYESSGQREKGTISVELVVTANGRVARSRRIGTTLKDRDLVNCVTSAMHGLTMPTARARSTANTDIYVAPGDGRAGSSPLP